MASARADTAIVVEYAGDGSYPNTRFSRHVTNGWATALPGPWRPAWNRFHVRQHSSGTEDAPDMMLRERRSERNCWEERAHCAQRSTTTTLRRPTILAVGQPQAGHGGARSSGPSVSARQNTQR